MKTAWLKNTGSGRLALVFLGYSFTPSCLAHIDLKGFDALLVYDYTSLEIDAEILKGREIWLAAWSMGAWTANRVFTGLAHSNLKRAVAINGTPFGIDETRGIKRADFAASIENFDFASFKKLCFLSELKRANFEFNPDPLTELKTLYAEASKPCENVISWDKAIISKRDLVFPPSACEWFACPKTYLNAPHFPFFKFESLEQIFEI